MRTSNPDPMSIMLAGLGSLETLENRIPQIEWRTEEIGGGDSTTIDLTTAPPGFVSPGAVPVAPEAWDTSTQPATYRIQAGDTLVGLAATYLGDGGRWREIWDVQTGAVRSQNSPDAITTTSRLRMPDEARDNFLVWVDRGKPTGTKPGETKPSEVEKIVAQVPGGRTGVLVGVGVLGLGALYLASRS